MANAEPIEIVRLRIKLDTCEFEAEGPRLVVESYFELWQKLVTTHLSRAAAALSPTGASSTAENHRPEALTADLRRNLILLNARPAGKNHEADAALLLLYGYQQLLGEEGQAVLGTRLKKSWSASGLRRTRIDRFLAKNVRARLVKKSGVRKASTYRLTPEGTQKAATMVQALGGSAAPGGA